MVHELHWFRDKIGKRIYRNEVSCKCDMCKDINKNGLIIYDQKHADYLHKMQSELNIKYYENN